MIIKQKVNFNIFKNSRLEEKRIAYNIGQENRKWLIWKEAKEKILWEHGVDETTIEQIRTAGDLLFPAAHFSVKKLASQS